MVCGVIDAEVLVAESVVQFQVDVAIFFEQLRPAPGLAGPRVGFIADGILSGHPQRSVRHGTGSTTAARGG